MKKLALYTFGCVVLFMVLSIILLPNLNGTITSASTYSIGQETITGEVIKSLENVGTSTTAILFALVVVFIYVFYFKK